MHRVRRWSRSHVLAALLLATGLGVALTLGSAHVLQWTNSEAFCVSCHEMRDNVFAEYRDSIHDRNRSGVRATCPDCHVPREAGALLLRKLQASGELLAHLRGALDTREKFEARRYALATKVWARMKETDSRECRHCHEARKMSDELQSDRTKRRHAKGETEGMTCIDCHYAIAHREPVGGPGPQEMGAAK